MTAREGQGEALAALMLRVAEGLRTTPGCEMYLVNRSASEPDVVWVTELWLGQEPLDASLQQLQTDAGREQLAEVQALLAEPPERIDLEPLGGVGYVAGGTGATIVNLDQVEDQAPKFGLGDVGEARFASGALETRRTGVSLQRLRPNARQAFGHNHQHAEEVYLVLSGSGRVKIDDEIHDLRPLDAVRVAPQSMRAFEAGDEGLEVLALGVRHPGDVSLARDFWTE